MDLSKQPTDEPMLTTAVLAAREDFTLGGVIVSPSTRELRGPSGTTDVEPRVMQVLLLLADAAGQVVTRETLFNRCWGGVYVGDDSLNRAVGAVRRSVATVGGQFEIETIPRTGYRLTVSRASASDETDEAGTAHDRASRRLFIAGGAAVAATAVGGLGLWSVRRSQADRRFDELMARGEQALDYGDFSDNSEQYYRQAVAIRPNDAKAQGLFAYSQAIREDSARAVRADSGEEGEVGAALQDAERASRAALAIDPNEPNARLAQVVVQRSMLDFAAAEDRFREILAMAPDNILVMRHLWGLLQITGRSRDSLAMIERADVLEPLAAGNHFPRAQLLWILGRTAEADRVIDRAMHYWPSHARVRFARFTIYAYTGRPRAALAMLNDAKTRPQMYSPEEISLWRVSLAALDQRTSTSIAAARNANLEAAKQNPSRSNIAILVLSALGDLDAAFDIANQLLLFRRPAELRPQAPARQPPVKSTGWRSAPWLFTPPVAPMRADPRFNALCDGIGLTEYWAKRRIKPDYQLGIT